MSQRSGSIQSRRRKGSCAARHEEKLPLREQSSYHSTCQPPDVKLMAAAHLLWVTEGLAQLRFAPRNTIVRSSLTGGVQGIQGARQRCRAAQTP